IKADIKCLQEVHAKDDGNNLWKQEWGNQAVFNHYTELLINDTSFFVTSYDYFINGRISKYVFEKPNLSEPLSIRNIYAPVESKNKAKFTKKLKMLVKYTHNHMVLGDFNLTEDGPRDRVPSKTNDGRNKDNLGDLGYNFGPYSDHKILSIKYKSLHYFEPPIQKKSHKIGC
ncbi:hypothetical protein BB559_001471, partial [Furculomyces boomerangus]